MVSLDSPKKEEIEEMRQTFSIIDTRDQILQSMAYQRTGPIAASELYSFAKGDKTNVLQIKKALLRSPEMRKILKQFLEMSAIYFIPQAIAAGSTKYPHRQIEGCAAKLEVSRSEKNIIFLVIQLEKGHIPPLKMSVMSPNGQFEEITLPSPRQNTIQVSLNSESPIPMMWEDPKTTISFH
mgnify:CR=1 FL=1